MSTEEGRRQIRRSLLDAGAEEITLSPRLSNGNYQLTIGSDQFVGRLIHKPKGDYNVLLFLPVGEGDFKYKFIEVINAAASSRVIKELHLELAAYRDERVIGREQYSDYKCLHTLPCRVAGEERVFVGCKQFYTPGSTLVDKVREVYRRQGLSSEEKAAEVIRLYRFALRANSQMESLPFDYNPGNIVIPEELTDPSKHAVIDYGDRLTPQNKLKGWVNAHSKRSATLEDVVGSGLRARYNQRYFYAFRGILIHHLKAAATQSAGVRNVVEFLKSADDLSLIPKSNSKQSSAELFALHDALLGQCLVKLAQSTEQLDVSDKTQSRLWQHVQQCSHVLSRLTQYADSNNETVQSIQSFLDQVNELPYGFEPLLKLVNTGDQLIAGLHAGLAAGSDQEVKYGSLVSGIKQHRHHQDYREGGAKSLSNQPAWVQGLIWGLGLIIAGLIMLAIEKAPTARETLLKRFGRSQWGVRGHQVQAQVLVEDQKWCNRVTRRPAATSLPDRRVLAGQTRHNQGPGVPTLGSESQL